MQISILGGTGDFGEGIACRLAQNTNHVIKVGSRDLSKAEEAVAAYQEKVNRESMEQVVAGSNPEIVENADLIIVSVPPQYIETTIKSIRHQIPNDTVVVSPAVSMERDQTGFSYARPDTGSVAEQVAAELPEGVPTVGAFHNLAAGSLANLKKELNYNVIVTSDDSEAASMVCSLIEEVKGLQPIYGGGLANTGEVEAITPLLINLAMENDDMHNVGVKFQ